MIKYKNRLAANVKSWGVFRDELKYFIRKGFVKYKRKLQLAKAYRMCCNETREYNYYDFKFRLMSTPVSKF